MTLAIATRPVSTQAMRIAFISACLHTVSPAGLFLSAPYAESSFALVNMSGYYLYAVGLRAHYTGRAKLRDTAIVLSGLLFGVAATLRSNGLLNGLIFCYDLITCFITSLRFGDLIKDLRKSVFVVIAGSLLGIGFIYPQYLAYGVFCYPSESRYQRSWCANRVPSIYTWVQAHYW